jgi:predicted nucleotidyltransferase
VDVLVQFDRSRGHLFDRYFELKESLEKLFDASVDLVIEDSLRNPYLKEAIEHSRINVYAA